jgi:hypothetical protein
LEITSIQNEKPGLDGIFETRRRGAVRVLPVAFIWLLSVWVAPMAKRLKEAAKRVRKNENK